MNSAGIFPRLGTRERWPYGLVIGRAVGSSHSTPPGHLWFAMAVSIDASIATRSSGRKTWRETFSVAQPGQKKRKTKDKFGFHCTVPSAKTASPTATSATLKRRQKLIYNNFKTLHHFACV